MALLAATAAAVGFFFFSFPPAIDAHKNPKRKEKSPLLCHPRHLEISSVTGSENNRLSKSSCSIGLLSCFSIRRQEAKSFPSSFFFHFDFSIVIQRSSLVFSFENRPDCQAVREGGRPAAATLAISDNDIPRRLCCRSNSAKFPQERHREKETKGRGIRRKYIYTSTSYSPQQQRRP